MAEDTPLRIAYLTYRGKPHVGGQGVYSRHLTKELEESFERDLADCTEFDPAEYEARNVGLRFRDSVARLLSPLL